VANGIPALGANRLATAVVVVAAEVVVVVARTTPFVSIILVVMMSPSVSTVMNGTRVGTTYVTVLLQKGVVG
jgi:hypothetical protein